MDSISLEAASSALSCIPASDRSIRVRVGEALRDEFGDDAFEAFDTWYATHDRYTQAESKQAWRSFGKGGRKSCTIATLIYEAKRRGFRFSRTHVVKRSPEDAQRIEAERAARREADRIEGERIHAAAAARAAAIWAAAAPAPAEHAYLVRKGIAQHGARWVPQWVKEWTDAETGEIREYRFDDALLVPIWSAPGKLASLQAILPDKVIGRAGEKRDKDYLSGGRKIGCYFLFGRVTSDTLIIIVCEGFATGASLHQATGLPVMAAFDAGNLAPVAEMLRGKLPEARIVIAADNDCWGSSGKNPGVEAAQRAAEASAAVVATPSFPPGVEGKPTDFNDLHAIAGLDAVRAAIDAALAPPEAEPEVAAAPEAKPAAPVPKAAKPKAEKKSRDNTSDDDVDVDGDAPEQNGFFAILGYNHGNYFIFTHGKRQLLEITKGDMSERGLLELAPLRFWEAKFGGSKGGIDTTMAANFLIQTAHKRGIYDPSRIRGRGAWIDDHRIVYHHGSYLTVDGEPTDITAIKSRYVYELDVSLPDPAEEPMRSDEGEELLSVAERFSWTKPGSAALLVGWVALAPLCGVLRWRPHLWITGGAGSGKSTVLNAFVKPLLGDLPVFIQGASTEAGIRQTLQSDALPVMFDEIESNEESDARRVQNVLSLIRQASTESSAQTLKGTAGGSALAYHIRSVFCLASIQVALRQKADTDRLTVLALQPPSQREGDPAAQWKSMETALHSACARDPTLPGRLFRRCLDMLPTTLKNIGVFVSVAAERFASQREGDQYGTLLAGTWSMMSTEVATREQAAELIDRYDWSEHREMAATDEADKAMLALMGAHVRIPGVVEVTVFELVSTACGHKHEGVDLSRDRANAILGRYGMRVRDDRLLLSNNSVELAKLMAGSGFEADLRGVLLRVPGADKNDNKAVKFHGVVNKAISLPLLPIVGSVVPVEQDDRPF